MKKAALIIGLLLVPLSANAENFTIKDLSAGMVSFPSANTIPDNAANYIQNFYTDIEPMAVERNGYLKADSTVLGGTKDVTGLWSFTDTSGNEWSIRFSSRTYYKNIAGGTPTAFGPISTVGRVPDAAINLGIIMFTNGTDAVWAFDGTTASTISSAPIGRQIEPWRNRFAIADIGGARSTIRFSADGSSTTWTLGGNPTDPFSVQIGGSNDGQYIRCLRNYQDSLIAGRKYDLWATDGFQQDDHDTRNISYEVGCLEPGTMKENNGTLMWLSNRGVEEMKGRSITLVSEPIRNIIDPLIKNTLSQRSNTQTSQADWTAGSFTGTVLSTSAYSGDVAFLRWKTQDTFGDGNFTAAPTWTVDAGSGFTVASNALNTAPTTATIESISSTSTAVTGVWTFRWRKTAGDSTTPYFKWFPMAGAYNGSNSYANGYVVYIGDIGFTRSLTVNRTSGTGTDTEVVKVQTGVGSFRDTDYHTIKMTRNTDGVMSFYWDNTLEFSVTNTTVTTSANTAFQGTGMAAGTDPIWDVDDYYYASDVLTDTPISASTSAVYTSQLIQIGTGISSWDTVGISDVLSGADIFYQFGSANTASVGAITNWSTIINGQVPTVSTNPYAAFRATFNGDASTDTARLSSFVTTWNEGSLNPSPVSTVYDRRYWLSFTTITTSSPYLDSILVWQRNKSWTLLKGINAASFAIWRDNLYFGNSNSTGYVYQFDTGTNDDGASIYSSIRTKSYDLGASHRDKDFRNVYVGYIGSPPNVGFYFLNYDINRYGTTYSLGYDVQSASAGQLSVKFPFPLFQLTRGREIQYVLNKSGTGDRLKLYDLTTVYELKEEP